MSDMNYPTPLTTWVYGRTGRRGDEIRRTMTLRFYGTAQLVLPSLLRALRYVVCNKSLDKNVPMAT